MSEHDQHLECGICGTVQIVEFTEPPKIYEVKSIVGQFNRLHMVCRQTEALEAIATSIRTIDPDHALCAPLSRRVSRPPVLHQQKRKNLIRQGGP